MWKNLFLLFFVLTACNAVRGETITVGATGSCPDLENGCDFDEYSLHLAVDYSEAGDVIVLYGTDVYVNEATAVSEEEALISITHQLTIRGYSEETLVKVHVGSKKRLFSIEHSQVRIENLEIVRPLTKVDNEEGQDVVLLVQGTYQYGGGGESSQQTKRSVVSLLNYGTLRQVTLTNVDFRSSKSHTNVIFSSGRYLDITIEGCAFGAPATSSSKKRSIGNGGVGGGNGAIDLTFGVRFVNLRVQDNSFDSVPNALNAYILPGSKSDASVERNSFYLSSARFYGDNEVVHNEQGCLDTPTESELVLTYRHNVVEGGRLGILYVHGSNAQEPLSIRDNTFYGVIQGSTPGVNVPKCMELKASLLMMDNNTMEDCSAIFTSDELTFQNSELVDTQLTMKPTSCATQSSHQVIRGVSLTGSLSKLYQPAFPSGKQGMLFVEQFSMSTGDTSMVIVDKHTTDCEMVYEHVTFNNVTDSDTHVLLYHTDPDAMSFNQYTSSLTGKVLQCAETDPDTGRPLKFDREACECVSLTAYELIVVHDDGHRTIRPVRIGYIANSDNTQEILIGSISESSPGTPASLTALWIVLGIVGGLLLIFIVVGIVLFARGNSGGSSSSYYAGAEYQKHMSAEDKRKSMYASVRKTVDPQQRGNSRGRSVHFEDEDEDVTSSVFIDAQSTIMKTPSSEDQFGLHHRINASAQQTYKAWRNMDTLDFAFEKTTEEDSE